MSKNSRIAPSASIEHPFSIGRNSSIASGVTVGSGGSIGNSCRIHREAVIAQGCDIRNGVIIGARVRIGRNVLLLNGAKVCPNDVRSRSSDARKLLDFVTIGKSVLLHDEVEIGEGAVIPTQRTIACIGNLGSKNRIVTIYGSDLGPRYSVGCQIGVDYDQLSGNVGAHSYTTAQSADTYAPFLPVFQEVGLIVQRAYDGESALVAEMLAMRNDWNPAKVSEG